MKSKKLKITRSWLFWISLVLLPLIIVAFYQKTQYRSRADLPQVYTPKVLLLIYNPTVSENQRLVESRNWGDPRALSQQVINTIGLTSNGKVNYSIAETVELDAIPIKADGWQYTTSQYLACLNSGGSNCHSPDTADYQAMIATVDACGKRNRGEIDELWIWGGPWFGFWESNLAGPNAFWYNSGPTLGTLCQELLPIMGFNYEVGADNAVHSYGHRVESTMAYTYGSWAPQETHAWNRYSLLDKDVPGRAGCGNVHYPPNTTHDYEYDNPTSVPSMCEDWLNYPNLTGTQQSFNCDRWDCTQMGYLSWWLRHIPQADGINIDGKLNNWWHYIADPQILVAGPGQFSNLSATFNENNATFNFNHSGVSTSQTRIDLSTTSDMSWDVYLSFGNGQNPIIVNDPQSKWDKYRCGTTLYWRAIASDGTQSEIQTSLVCDPQSSPLIPPSPTPQPTPTVQFKTTTSNISENTSNATVLVELSAPAHQQTSVNYQIIGGSALAGTDYQLSGGTLTFLTGVQTVPIMITVLDDIENETKENVYLQLSNPVRATLGKFKHVFTIIDND